MRVAILTVSDRCSRGEVEDKSGPTLRELFLASKVLGTVALSDIRLVPDERQLISSTLIDLASNHDVIATTGGTGFAPRDVTPEATLDVIEKRCGGVETALLIRGIQATPLAALSRLVVGIRGSCLIVNLPGSSKAVKEGFEVLEPLLNHGVRLLRDEPPQAKTTLLTATLESPAPAATQRRRSSVGMKFRDSLVSLMGDFVQMNKAPEGRLKAELPEVDEKHSHVASSTAPNHNRNRRHSLNITVGAEEIPRAHQGRQRTQSISELRDDKSQMAEAARQARNNRRLSAPVISTSDARGSLKKKLQQLRLNRETSTSEEEEEEEENGFNASQRSRPRTTGTIREEDERRPSEA